MPPKKPFSGQVRYVDRNIHDDLLELLPESTVEPAQVKKLTSLNPKLKIADGLYDKGNWVRDATTAQSGLILFKKWFSERKLFAPHANVWNFDLGKLVVPSVFMDYDLLEAIAKNYDQAIRVVRRKDGKPLLSINPEEIREVFHLEPLSEYHVSINLPELESEYKTKKDAIRGGALRTHIGTIGSLPVITAASREPFKMSLFTSRAVEIYRTLCLVLGEDEQEFMPIGLMYMMIQIASYGVDVIFDFASFLAEEIHSGLVGIAKGNLNRIFGHYSLLMHMFLFKGVTYFGDEMELNREENGEILPVQLWSADMTWDANKASFVRFDRNFASKLRSLILSENPRIPKVLMSLIRPMDNPHNLKVSHNWGDIIPYSVSTIFRIYGYKGTPHVLPYQVPLKVGVAEVLWQMGGVEEMFLMKRQLGSLFPTCTVAHQFVITKGGWLFLSKILERYKMAVSHPRFCDSEGFFNQTLRHRIKLGEVKHDSYYPEDIIRNEFSLQEQETKKEKWRVYSRVLEFIHYFDKNYGPLDNASTEADKIKKLMNNFPEIMKAMNEKKQLLIDSHPNKAREVMRRLAFTPKVGTGQIIVQKKPGYTVIPSKKVPVDKGKQVMGSTSMVLEERPEEPSPKRQKIIQSPPRTEEEQITGEQIEQMGSQGDVFITQAELDEGNPPEPSIPSLDLTVADYSGRELDPVLEQASHQFLTDDNFVKSRAFQQFAWRVSMSIFEEKCRKMKTEHPEMDEIAIQEQIKEEMIKELQNISPEEGRRMVKASNILLLPGWDIADALVFNSVSNRLTLQDQHKENFQGTTFIEDQAALVSWSLKRGSRTTSVQADESGLMGSLIVRRVADTSLVQAAHWNVDSSKFLLATAKKEEQAMIELQNKYETALEAYNKEVKRRIELEDQIKMSLTRPRISYPSRPPVESSKSTPIIEIPDTPERPQFYTIADFEEERNKMYALHMDLNTQYEDKLKKALVYLVDKIEWPLFFDQLARVINIWEQLKTHDETLKPIVSKWERRKGEIAFSCHSVKRSSRDHLKKLNDTVSELSNFDHRRVALQLKIVSSLSKYKSKKFDLFPRVLNRKNQLKNKDEWSKELSDLFDARMNKVVNEKGHTWWATTTEELVKVQLFFDSLKQEFVSFEEEANYVLTKQEDILRINWPDDVHFNTWMADTLSDEQTEEDSCHVPPQPS